MIVDVAENLFGRYYEVCHFPDGLMWSLSASVTPLIAGQVAMGQAFAYGLEIHGCELEEPPEEGRYPHAGSPLCGRHG